MGKVKMHVVPALAALAIVGFFAWSAVVALGAVGGCGSSGDVRTTAACYRIGDRAAWRQAHKYPRRSASWNVSCAPSGACPYTMSFTRAGFAAVKFCGSATVTGGSGDWRKRHVVPSDRRC